MKKIPFILFSILLICLVVFVYLKFSPTTYPSHIIFFNIGQGDSALIFLPNNLKVLVDCGPNKTILSKLGERLSFFDKTIDYLIITHPDLDHYGGCSAVLKNYKIKNIVMNVDKKNDEYYKEFSQAVDSEQANIKIIDQAQKWQAGNYFFEFLSPDSSFGDLAGNDNSIVFRLVGGKQTVLFTGDLETTAEKLVVEKYCGVELVNCDKLKSDILKAGHHGSDTSSSDDFLSAVQPTTAIISVGKNSFGHPSLRTLNKLERAGTTILRTDEEGDIIILE
jgi:competence protein ComEC